MEKIISIGGQNVRMRASALIPRLYRHKFGRDMISDINKLQTTLKGGNGFDEADFSILEDVAYIMAKHADPDVPSDVEDWLVQFPGVMDVYNALPDILGLWAENNRTTSVPRKK